MPKRIYPKSETKDTPKIPSRKFGELEERVTMKKAKPSVDCSAKRIADEFMQEKKKEQKSVKADLFNRLFAQGERLGLDREKTKQFLVKEGIAFDSTGELSHAVSVLQHKKAVDENSADELIRWRIAVKERMEIADMKFNHVRSEFYAAREAFQKAKNRWMKKGISNLLWFDQLSVALSRRMRGEGLPELDDECEDEHEREDID